MSETDRYGWLLRYVYVGGTFVRAALVRNGYALAATFSPDVAHAAYFATLQAEGAGLWSGCPTPTPQPTAAPSACLCSGDLYNCSDFDAD
ncbi:MAG: thermonuclease family protein [Chloroflexi bacterium]|nr:thermonuclease family protein [Chloroflexota bacterium]